MTFKWDFRRRWRALVSTFLFNSLQRCTSVIFSPPQISIYCFSLSSKLLFMMRMMARLGASVSSLIRVLLRMSTRVSLPSLLSISCSLPLFLSLCTPFNLFTPSDLHSKSSLPSGKIWTPRGSKSQKPIRLNTSCSHRRLLAH